MRWPDSASTAELVSAEAGTAVPTISNASDARAQRPAAKWIWPILKKASLAKSLVGKSWVMRRNTIAASPGWFLAM